MNCKIIAGLVFALTISSIYGMEKGDEEKKPRGDFNYIEYPIIPKDIPLSEEQRAIFIENKPLVQVHLFLISKTQDGKLKYALIRHPDRDMWWYPSMLLRAHEEYFDCARRIFPAIAIDPRSLLGFFRVRMPLPGLNEMSPTFLDTFNMVVIAFTETIPDTSELTWFSLKDSIDFRINGADNLPKKYLIAVHKAVLKKLPSLTVEGVLSLESGVQDIQPLLGDINYIKDQPQEESTKNIPAEIYPLRLAWCPVICVDVMLGNQEEQSYLMIERDNKPAKGLLWFPGGSLNALEEIHACARRKCRVEGGQKIKDLPLLIGVFRTRFPDSAWNEEATDTINIVVFGWRDSSTLETNATEDGARRWIPLDTAPETLPIPPLAQADMRYMQTAYELAMSRFNIDLARITEQPSIRERREVDTSSHHTSSTRIIEELGDLEFDSLFDETSDSFNQQPDLEEQKQQLASNTSQTSNPTLSIHRPKTLPQAIPTPKRKTQNVPRQKKAYSHIPQEATQKKERRGRTKSAYQAPHRTTTTSTTTTQQHIQTTSISSTTHSEGISAQHTYTDVIQQPSAYPQRAPNTTHATQQSTDPSIASLLACHTLEIEPRTRSS